MRLFCLSRALAVIAVILAPGCAPPTPRPKEDALAGVDCEIWIGPSRTSAMHFHIDGASDPASDGNRMTVAKVYGLGRGFHFLKYPVPEDFENALELAVAIDRSGSAPQYSWSLGGRDIQSPNPTATNQTKVAVFVTTEQESAAEKDDQDPAPFEFTLHVHLEGMHFEFPCSRRSF